MSRSKTRAGSYNLAGEKIRYLRLSYTHRLSQRNLAEKMQLLEIDLDKNAIQRIEAGERSITDIELVAFSNFFNVSLDELVKPVIQKESSSS